MFKLHECEPFSTISLAFTKGKGHFYTELLEKIVLYLSTLTNSSTYYIFIVPVLFQFCSSSEKNNFIVPVLVLVLRKMFSVPVPVLVLELELK